MKQVYKYDDNGFYIEPILIGKNEELPPNCTDLELPQPNWKPKFDGVKWIETITQEELNEILNSPKPKTLEERQAATEAAIDFLLMGGM